MQVQIAGMAWYKPENFIALRKMFTDGHKLHRTYSEWLAAAESNQKGFEAKGIRVVRVDIDPNEFSKWCAAQGFKLDAAARMQYANVIAYKVATGVQESGGVH